MASVALAPPADTGLIRAPPKPLLLAPLLLLAVRRRVSRSCWR